MITAIDRYTALVLIDLQKGIVKGQTAHPIKNILEEVVHLVNAFRAAKLPIVVVNVNPAGAAWTKARTQLSTDPKINIEQQAIFIEMSKPGNIEITAEIKTEQTDIFITKKTWNAFFETTLHSDLQKRNITGIILAGLSTSAGVESTARAASELGYNISFATDAVTDKSLASHNNSLQNIFPRIGELGTSQEIICFLQKN